MTLEVSSGMAMRFSDLYKPGAMKPQTWAKITGIARKTARTIDNLKGVKKGDVTSVAIIEDPSGSRLLKGSEMKVYNSLAKGNSAMNAMKTAMSAFRNRSLSSRKCATSGMGSSALTERVSHCQPVN
jgi:hypothetical protein